MTMDSKCLIEAELRARSAYSQPGRHYHDARHLDECIAELDGIDWLDDRQRRVLQWAILWHDAIYEPGRTDNEDRSADLAERELDACEIAQEDVAEVARLIRLTKSHKTEPGDRLGALMVSIDLAILGSDPDSYRRYVSGVRAEYAHVPDLLWQAGRSEMLRRLLASDPLYPDPEYRNRLEVPARRNLTAELSSLDEG